MKRFLPVGISLHAGAVALVFLIAPGGLWCDRAVAAQPQPVAVVQTADPVEYVAPELRPALEATRRMMERTGASGLNAQMLKNVRQMTALATPEFLPAPAVEEHVIPGPADAPDVRILVIAAEKDASRPAILYLHGGGFVVGSAASGITVLQPLALKHDCVIVSVDYRLAPETPFPGPVEDAYSALQWMVANAAVLGIDPSRIAVMGDSAGGGLAAMLALLARDRAEVSISQQILIYPMLDDRTGSTVQMPYWMGAYSWSAESNRFGWSSLLGVPAGSEKVPAGAVPARETNLAGLPPTFIAVGSVDLFVNEDIDYAQRLINAGVPTELLVVPGGYHAFQHGNPDAILTQNFNNAIDAAISRAFVPPQAPATKDQ